MTAMTEETAQALIEAINRLTETIAQASKQTDPTGIDTRGLYGSIPEWEKRNAFVLSNNYMKAAKP